MGFKKGESGNPSGKPPGLVSPVTRVRNLIVDIFLENEAGFKTQLRRMVQKDPIDYYQKFVTPFMPRDLNITGDLNIIPRTATKGEALTRLDEIEKRLTKTSKKRAAGT